jgi:hypothetical protein
MNESHMDYVR